LIFDEVQTGCGRTGQWFAYQHFGVTPDIMTLAKALCGGIAGGAMLTTREVAPSLRPGMHASTYGGNPIAARAGIATLETIERDGLLQHTRTLSELFQQQLAPLVDELEIVREIRILGLMIGIDLAIDGSTAVQHCMDRGLLINCTHQTVLRLLPAMNLAEDLAREGCEIIRDVLTQLAS
ncbi:MAG: aminotransferase class III-fold pyridoxal phosphate-dependent enzyme, partial [Planctomycetales bacterium]|nr:aminotransferase class III-fold pyridoxal phosphate-dependent enzyme [Planctomycetales bacterium]